MDADVGTDLFLGVRFYIFQFIHLMFIDKVADLKSVSSEEPPGMVQRAHLTDI